MPLTVKPLAAADCARWDAFVVAQPDGTFFHRAGWRSVIERAFGHRTCYVYTERDGRITGVLPLVQVHSALFGNALISTAFCVHGGPLASDSPSRTALCDYAIDEMQRLGASRLEFRLRRPSGSDWPQKSGLYATFRRPIEADPQKNLKAVPRKQRAVIRKSLGHGLIAECDQDVRRLHRIYAESVRNLGTPVFSQRYFQALVDQFGDDAEVLTVVDQGKPLAAVLSFFFRDEVLPYYAGGVGEARQRAAYDFMYWEVMCRAAARGCRIFDFGRSKFGTGPFDFKKNWGFVPEPLVHEYQLQAGQDIPELNPLNPKYRLYIEAWKRLPLPIANLLGPHIVRGLG
jgi:FemAB-related protein (PEP-CTERM system-associated)